MAAQNEAYDGFSKRGMFRVRLDEYACILGWNKPVYETTEESGMCRSTVTVNGVRYNSLVGFSGYKRAEQSAAEIAMRELCKSGDTAQGLPKPVYETGLCKDVLEDYARKMKYAIPVYHCKDESNRLFSCMIEIGGVYYIGATARNKKEAEIKVARTALLAIRLSGTVSSLGSIGNSELKVLPLERARRMPGQSEEAYLEPGLESNEFVKPMTAEAMSEDIPHANDVYVSHGLSTASDLTNSIEGRGFVGCRDITALVKAVNTVPAIKPMDTDAMAHDSLSEHTPCANNVDAEHRPSTTSDLNVTNMSCVVVGSATL